MPSDLRANHTTQSQLIILSLVWLTFAVSASDRDPHADKELSYTKGKTLYQSDFSKDDLASEPWNSNHGTWKIRNGNLFGITNTEENHAAALSLMIKVPEKQLVSLDFNLAKDESFSLCFIGGPGPHGRVQITPKEFYLWMKAGDTGAACVIDYAPLNLSIGEWHSLAFIRNGTDLIATIDGKHRISGRHEKFTSPKKRINLGADAPNSSFDNIAVVNLSEVKASPELFTKPSYTLSEFWSMREEKYGLIRQANTEKKNKKTKR
jgi:hypothetical protein